MNDVLDFISYLGGLIVGLLFLFVLIGATFVVLTAYVYTALFQRRQKHDLTPDEEFRERYYDEIV